MLLRCGLKRPCLTHNPVPTDTRTQHYSIETDCHFIQFFYISVFLNFWRHPDLTRWCTSCRMELCFDWLVCLCVSAYVCDVVSLNTGCALRRFPAVETPPCSRSQTHRGGFFSRLLSFLLIRIPSWPPALAGGCKSVCRWGRSRTFQVLLKLLEIWVSFIRQLSISCNAACIWLWNEF